VSRLGYLFFDLDGTIADSGAGITQSVNDLFAAVGAAPLTETEVRRIIGPPFQTTMPELLTARGIDVARTTEFIHEYRRIYRQHHLPFTPVIDGMREVVNTLAATWHISVVTAKPQTQADIAVKATQLDHHMVTVVGPADDAPVHKSVLLRRAIDDVVREHGSMPDLSRCWMIGDRHHDIEAGVQVGTRSAGVLWGFGDHAELAEAGADVVLSRPVDLLSLLVS
jgi:phosphoglycolate phosphatase